MIQPLMMSAFGELIINRVPLAKKEMLQAFDQADLLALDYLQLEALLLSLIHISEPTRR